MTQIDQQTLQILQEQFLGKRVSVDTPKGKFAGVCNFIGHNEFFPSFGLQITLDRTPVTNIEIRNIKLLEDTRLFKN